MASQTRRGLQFGLKEEMFRAQVNKPDTPFLFHLTELPTEELIRRNETNPDIKLWVGLRLILSELLRFSNLFSA